MAADLLAEHIHELNRVLSVLVGLLEFDVNIFQQDETMETLFYLNSNLILFAIHIISILYVLLGSIKSNKKL